MTRRLLLATLVTAVCMAARHIEPDALLRPVTQQTAMRTQQPYQLGASHRPPLHRRTNRRGIDVSHYQGNVNWQAVAADEQVSYVYIKATENASLVDNKYAANLRGARKAGIPAGTYHFFSPNASATAQMLNLTRAMPDLSNQDLVPMIDVEVRGRCSLNDFRSRLRQFLIAFEDRYGVKPLIYTGTNFYNKYLCGHFDGYLFMIAKYGDEMPDLDGNPKFAMWQYSASGRVAGIRGDVDLSCFVDSYDLRHIMLR